jgi:cbb3-type cytochrome c oxidase subunit III
MALTFDTHAQDGPNPLLGNHLYRSYCLVCHGVDGKSVGPLARKLGFEPADLSSQTYQAKTVAELATIIAGYQRPGDSNMPSWAMALSQTELLHIAAYVSEINRTDLRHRGDTRRGRIIFKSACVACHGKDGTGRGVLAHLIQIAMIDFTMSENMKGMSDEDLVKLIREGKGDYMPSWKGALSDDEITDVASYVRMLAR